MAKWIIMMSALVACVAAEPPRSGYSYSAPSSSLLLLGGGSGYSLGSSGGYSGGGYSGGGYSLGGSSGGYRAVPSGYQTSEGQYVDPHLLEEIKNILLKDEIQNQQYRGSNSIGIGHGISSSYGVPSPVYGVPKYNERVVGIELGNIKQGIQVAQYLQDGGYADGYSGGYSLGSGGYSLGGGSGYSLGGGSGYSLGGGSGYSLGGGSGYSLGGSGHGLSLSSGYSSGPSSIGYNTIAIPSGTYGVPLPSSRYGSPRH